MLNFSGFHYQFITPHALETAQSLIEHYDLHRYPDDPVNIGLLLDKFDLQFLDLPDTTLGLTLDTGHNITIAINDSLSTGLTRFVAMHEIGHIACNHPNHLHNCLDGQWNFDRHEAEASTVAAYVLIPHLAVSADPLGFTSTALTIAKQYIVPPELALIRRVIFQRTGK